MHESAWLCALLAPSAWAQWNDEGLSQVAFGVTGICSAGRIAQPEIPGLEILSLTVVEMRNHTVKRNPNLGLGTEPFRGLSFCNVTVTYTHPGWNDNIKVMTFLPTRNWNGRFQANGGGGLTTGGAEMLDFTLLPALELGFSVSTTDGGHSDSIVESWNLDPDWPLSSPGNVNWPLLLDFSYISLHDMAVIGKAITEDFYGEPPKYSYFYGASTGGRQGLALAQKYPKDFDGILSVCPAINWTKFLWATFWPLRVMDKVGVYPPPCEFQAIGAAAVKACDTLDGVEDGVISMPSRCVFDPHTLVGQSFDCDGTEKTITAAAAEAVAAAWTGPRSSAGEFQWYGFGKDSVMWGSMGPLATKCGEDGKCDGIRFAISDVWIRYFVAKDSNLDARAISPQQWDDLFKASVNEYESIIGTTDPDLSRFRSNGGKLITWHGMADQLIPINGSVEYADRVLAHDPNAHDFYRLFLAPGADHSMRRGITPKDPLKSLAEWVEDGVVPKVLRAAGPNGFGVQVERDICVYPQVQHYVSGDPAVSSSFRCT